MLIIFSPILKYFKPFEYKIQYKPTVTLILFWAKCIYFQFEHVLNLTVCEKVEILFIKIRNKYYDKTTILKVLHGIIKSPTDYIYPWRYIIVIEVK